MAHNYCHRYLLTMGIGIFKCLSFSNPIGFNSAFCSAMNTCFLKMGKSINPDGLVFSVQKFLFERIISKAAEEGHISEIMMLYLFFWKHLPARDFLPLHISDWQFFTIVRNTWTLLGNTRKVSKLSVSKCRGDECQLVSFQSFNKTTEGAMRVFLSEA